MGKNEKDAAAASQMGGQDNPWQGQSPQPGVAYQFVPGAGFVPVGAPGPYACHGPGFGHGHGFAHGFGPGHAHGYGPYYGPLHQPYMGGPGMPPPPPPYGPEAADAHHAHHSHHGYGPQGPDMGQMYGMVNDVMQGKGDPGKLLGLFQAPGGEFWKGALVGAAAVLLLNSSGVKETLASVFGAMTGQPGEAEQGNPGQGAPDSEGV